MHETDMWGEVILEIKEIKLILDYLQDQYIDYNNKQLHQLLKEMHQWLASQSGE